MIEHRVVSKAEWLDASRELLVEEKAWTRERDRLSEKRRRLPWVRVEKNYSFQAIEGPVTLQQLFDGRSQLIVYHFMFAPDWDEGCLGCSLLCDQVDGARQHFEHKGVSWVAVSRGPIDKLQAYRKRMGWTFRWVSSAGSDFNFDFHVSFRAGERQNGVFYNFVEQPDPGIDELSGISVFYKDEDGAIYHTYSNCGRGGEIFMPVYSWLDIAPKGRDEHETGNLGGWVKRHDSYLDHGRTERSETARGEPSECCAAAS